jgi:hypothetical protein
MPNTAVTERPAGASAPEITLDAAEEDRLGLSLPRATICSGPFDAAEFQLFMALSVSSGSTTLKVPDAGLREKDRPQPLVREAVSRAGTEHRAPVDVTEVDSRMHGPCCSRRNRCREYQEQDHERPAPHPL